MTRASSTEIEEKVMRATVILTFACFLLLGSMSSGTDYTNEVAHNDRLRNVFGNRDVSNPNNFQALLIKLCKYVDSCGNHDLTNNGKTE